MILKLIVRLSALSLGLSYVTCTTPQQQAQLATLHERMNQMISSLYSSPLLSKVQAATSSEDFPAPSSQDTSYNHPPAPHIVYVAPPPTYLDVGAHPTDYGYPTTTNPVQRSAWPYPYDLNTFQYAPPAYPSYPRSPYPDYSRYSQIAMPPLPPILPYSAPLPYPSPYTNSVPIPTTYPPPLPAAGLPSHYPPTLQYPPSPYPQAPYGSPIAYGPPAPYPPAQYPAPIPQPYFPPLPIAFPPPAAAPHSIPVPYSQPMSYPQPLYGPPPAYPKPLDILPQYDYSI